MCGRYYYDDYMWADLRRDLPELADAGVAGLSALPLGSAESGLGGFGSGGFAHRDICPSMRALALTAERDAAVRARQMVWGFPGFDGKKLIINARAEGIAGKRTFADSIRSRRCVLPAAGRFCRNAVFAV